MRRSGARARSHPYAGGTQVPLEPDQATPGGARGRPGRGQAPSSRERSVAAVTASKNAARTPRRSSSRSPAAVVPPGEVTAARSPVGVAPPCTNSRADPSSVWKAASRLRPAAGRRARRPRPSLPRPGTRMPDPIPRVRSPRPYLLPPRARPFRRHRESPRPTPGPPRGPSLPVTAAAAAPITAGMLGMARTTRSRPLTARSIASVVTPAAIDNTRSAPASAIATAASAASARLDGQDG
jgi:hypothetical protein